MVSTVEEGGRGGLTARWCFCRGRRRRAGFWSTRRDSGGAWEASWSDGEGRGDDLEALRWRRRLNGLELAYREGGGRGGDLEHTAKSGEQRSRLLESRRKSERDLELFGAVERPGASGGAATELRHVRAEEGLERRVEGRSSLLASWRCSGEASEQLRRIGAHGGWRRSSVLVGEDGTVAAGAQP